MKIDSTVPCIIDTLSEQAEVLDYYPTPRGLFAALHKHEKFPGTVWEPACGTGELAKEMKNCGVNVVLETDKVNYGYGNSIGDFRNISYSADHIITNPPYRLSREFIQHAVGKKTRGQTVSQGCAKSKVAMLLDLNFLASAIRRDFFADYTPVRIWVFRQRITMYSPASLRKRLEKRLKDGLDITKKPPPGTRAYAWYVWDTAHRGLPTVDWLDLSRTDCDAMRNDYTAAWDKLLADRGLIPAEAE